MKNQKLLESLRDKIIFSDYGDVFTHKFISDFLGTEQGNTQYKTSISWLKKECLKNCKMLKNVVNTGYVVVKPGEYAEQAVKQYYLGAKRLDKGTEILKFAPTIDMTSDELNAYRNVADRAIRINAQLTGAVIELQLLESRKHPLKEALNQKQ